MLYFWVTTKKIWAGWSGIAHTHALCSFLSWNTSLRVWAQGPDNGIHGCVRQWDGLAAAKFPLNGAITVLCSAEATPKGHGPQVLNSFPATNVGCQPRKTDFTMIRWEEGGGCQLGDGCGKIIFPQKKWSGPAGKVYARYENSWIPELGFGDHCEMMKKESNE